MSFIALPSDQVVKTNVKRCRNSLGIHKCDVSFTALYRPHVCAMESTAFGKFLLRDPKSSSCRANISAKRLRYHGFH